MRRVLRSLLLYGTVLLFACTAAPRAARLYDVAGTQQIIAATFQGKSIVATQGTMTLTTPTGEICSGEYSATPTNSSWGRIYYSSNVGVSGTAKYNSSSKLYYGTAVAMGDRGTVFQCEFLAEALGAAHGACTDNRGHSYRLMFD